MRSITLILVAVSFLLPTAGEKKAAEVTFCQFDLPESIKAAHASFNVIYSFSIDEKGTPTKIVKVLDNYVGQDKVIPCLKKWHFGGVRSGATMVAAFRWEHAEGWTELSIEGSDFSQKIRLEGRRCPYR